jgi:hypothetical protein
MRRAVLSPPPRPTSGCFRQCFQPVRRDAVKCSTSRFQNLLRAAATSHASGLGITPAYDDRVPAVRDGLLTCADTVVSAQGSLATQA